MSLVFSHVDSFMNQHLSHASTASRTSPAGIDETLWDKIDAAVGGPVHFDAAVFIEGTRPGPHVMVVVVERCRIPSEEELRSQFKLTPRESEVARLLADRLSDEEIAGRLDIRINTARCHSYRVLGKLGVHSRNDVRTVLMDRDATPVDVPSRDVA